MKQISKCKEITKQSPLSEDLVEWDIHTSNLRNKQMNHKNHKISQDKLLDNLAKEEINIFHDICPPEQIVLLSTHEDINTTSEIKSNG